MGLVKDNKKQEKAWTSGLGVVTKVTPLLKSLRTALHCVASVNMVHHPSYQCTSQAVGPSDSKSTLQLSILSLLQAIGS